MAKMERVRDIVDRMMPLRVYRRKGRNKIGPSIRIKCGCCDQAVVIYFAEERSSNPNNDTLEINGVIGTVSQWKKVLLPLLDVDDKPVTGGDSA